MGPDATPFGLSPAKSKRLLRQERHKSGKRPSCSPTASRFKDTAVETLVAESKSLNKFSSNIDELAIQLVSKTRPDQSTEPFAEDREKLASLFLDLIDCEADSNSSKDGDLRRLISEMERDFDEAAAKSVDGTTEATYGVLLKRYSVRLTTKQSRRRKEHEE